MALGDCILSALLLWGWWVPLLPASFTLHHAGPNNLSRTLKTTPKLWVWGLFHHFCTSRNLGPAGGFFKYGREWEHHPGAVEEESVSCWHIYFPDQFSALFWCILTRLMYFILIIALGIQIPVQNNCFYAAGENPMHFCSGVQV